MIADPAIGRPVDRRRRLFVLCDNGDVWVVPFPDLDRGRPGVPHQADCSPPARD